jgi:beta-1,4-mannosyl-glycoprotein beta-1,4-N-acetylglucosaminyltransferase
MATPDVIELLPFNDETDILQARVQLMVGTVDHHLVVEGNRTHQGTPKPFHLDGTCLSAHVSRYPAYLPSGDGDTLNWQRERRQRDVLAVWIDGVDPDTLVISADVDELVDPGEIPRIADACQHGPVSLAMRMIYYGNREDPNGWCAAKAFRARHTPDSLSDLRLSACPPVPDCGWHLSYLGDTARRRRKIEAFAHAENRQPTPWARIAGGQDGPNGEQLIDFDPTGLPPILEALVAGA